MGFWGSKMSRKVKTGSGVATRASKMFKGRKKRRRKKRKSSTWQIR